MFGVLNNFCYISLKTQGIKAEKTWRERGGFKGAEGAAPQDRLGSVKQGTEGWREEEAQGVQREGPHKVGAEKRLDDSVI